jgi:hypothetical protein
MLLKTKFPETLTLAWFSVIIFWFLMINWSWGVKVPKLECISQQCFTHSCSFWWWYCISSFSVFQAHSHYFQTANLKWIYITFWVMQMEFKIEASYADV